MPRNNAELKHQDEHQRRSAGMSSHPPDLNSAHVSNVQKLEKDLKSNEDAPVEQHRSSRRPRPRKQQNSH
ncbi:MAG: hypothetical protein QOF78_1619 [Phycisphaerales bacterium]|jgi:hypothetical protein|nr:hypothetical protein [Phycisphaerales bacterium]